MKNFKNLVIFGTIAILGGLAYEAWDNMFGVIAAFIAMPAAFGAIFTLMEMSAVGASAEDMAHREEYENIKKKIDYLVAVRGVDKLIEYLTYTDASSYLSPQVQNDAKEALCRLKDSRMIEPVINLLEQNNIRGDSAIELLLSARNSAAKQLLDSIISGRISDTGVYFLSSGFSQMKDVWGDDSLPVIGAIIKQLIISLRTADNKDYRKSVAETLTLITGQMCQDNEAWEAWYANNSSRYDLNITNKVRS